MAHTLEAATIILCVVVFGKFLENKAKRSIVTMTAQIFPERQLLQNLNLKLLVPKNRNFVIEAERDLDIILIDKDDLIRVSPGMRLLLDGIVVHQESAEPL